MSSKESLCISPYFPLSSRASSPPEVVDSIEERWPDLLASDDEVDAPVGGETVFAAQHPPAGALFVAGAINGHLCRHPHVGVVCHSRDGIGPGQFHCG